jgi:hypothetical protein
METRRTVKIVPLVEPLHVYMRIASAIMDVGIWTTAFSLGIRTDVFLSLT